VRTSIGKVHVESVALPDLVYHIFALEDREIK